MFEKEINEKLETGLSNLNVLIIPVTRDRLLPAIVDGYGDIAAANLTITPERLETVQYVSNIYKYYVAYRLIADQVLLREAA